MKNKLLVLLGWFFVVLAAIGMLLPLLPTTPFLILALALFAKSSPHFHKMLLDNRWFGEVLKQWEDNKTVSGQTKRRASLLIVISFSISIALLNGRLGLQFMLLVLAVILLVLIWKLRTTTSR